MGHKKEGKWEKGLRAILGLSLPSKGPCIKDKSFDLVFILIVCKQEYRALLPSPLCVESCFYFHLLPLLLRLRSIHPFTTLTLLFFLLSPPSPYDRVVARRRIRGRCSWHHRSSIIDQLSQGSGEEVSSPSGSLQESPRHVNLRQGGLNNFGTVAGEVGNLLWSIVVVFLVFTLV